MWRGLLDHLDPPVLRDLLALQALQAPREQPARPDQQDLKAPRDLRAVAG